MGQAVLLFPAFHLLVASSPVQDLLPCAKHLFVEASNIACLELTPPGIGHG
jgi:hypothetical protein